MNERIKKHFILLFLVAQTSAMGAEIFDPSKTIPPSIWVGDELCTIFVPPACPAPPVDIADCTTIPPDRGVLPSYFYRSNPAVCGGAPPIPLPDPDSADFIGPHHPFDIRARSLPRRGIFGPVSGPGVIGPNTYGPFISDRCHRASFSPEFDPTVMNQTQYPAISDFSPLPARLFPAPAPRTRAREFSLKCVRGCGGQVAAAVGSASDCLGGPGWIGAGAGAAGVASECAAYAGMSLCEWTRYVAGAAAGVAAPGTLIGAGAGCAANVYCNYDELSVPTVKIDGARRPSGIYPLPGCYGTARDNDYIGMDYRTGCYRVIDCRR